MRRYLRTAGGILLVFLLAAGLWFYFAGGSSDQLAGPPHLYPNPALTPGAVIPGVTARDVSTPGYAKRARKVTESQKNRIYAKYGIKRVKGSGQYEVDHFIPLSLGGSNDDENLWPEPYNPRPGAFEKDKVESYLYHQVRKGNITLQEAQELIRKDWYKLYLQIKDKKPAPDERDDPDPSD